MAFSKKSNKITKTTTYTCLSPRVVTQLPEFVKSLNALLSDPDSASHHIIINFDTLCLVGDGRVVKTEPVMQEVPVVKKEAVVKEERAVKEEPVVKEEPKSPSFTPLELLPVLERSPSIKTTPATQVKQEAPSLPRANNILRIREKKTS